jgi:hypothetical protein
MERGIDMTDYKKWQTPNNRGQYVLPNGRIIFAKPSRDLIDRILEYQYYDPYNTVDKDGWFHLPDGTKQRNMPTRAQIRSLDPNRTKKDGASDWAVELVGKAFEEMRDYNKKVEQFVDDLLSGKITEKEADAKIRKGL